MIRNNKVCDYRLKVSDEDYFEAVENIVKGEYFKTCRKYDKLPSYNTMVLYFWIPLTNENWVGFTTLRNYYANKFYKQQKHKEELKK